MEFLIRKGHHYSLDTMVKLYALTTEFDWVIKFSKECWYDEKDTKIIGYNKLRGITFGTHQETWFGKYMLTKWAVNSALIAWMPDFRDENKERINLYLYYDRDGKEYRKLFTSVKVEEPFTVKYAVKHNEVEITLNGNKYYMYPKTWLKFGYHLWPYFGGECTAPHDMVIYIDDVVYD